MLPESQAGTPGIFAPILALTLYAIAAGYLMSLLPLSLAQFAFDDALASWLASSFYIGLLAGTLGIEPVLKRLGFRPTYLVCLALFTLTAIALPLYPQAWFWLALRLLAGFAVAGIFVVVESWLMAGEPSTRAKRLSLYMVALYGGTAFGQLGINLFGTSGVAPFISITLVMVAAFLVMVLLPNQAPNHHHSARLELKQILKLNHSALFGCLISGLALSAIYGLMPLALAARGIAEQDIGTLMALVILGGMAVQPLITLLNKYLAPSMLMVAFNLLGVLALALSLTSESLKVLALAVLLLGAASFALYPIAIDLGCQQLQERYMISAAQVMLLSYSVGSVLGPLFAEPFMAHQHGFFTYLFITLAFSAIYILLASLRSEKAVSSESE
ncbi:MFS transporter [Pseudoalteromonas sp. T1lg76]|uniref:MFS transporter n=1 Tax=Pseudoalteromonas sp. T1lg76 TaxID=2077103 RepID=UPI001F40AD47|nr:MFS transporter [Pseudoalteromonas sp. T1lg76]